MKKTILKITQLDLDIENPRFKPEENQTEAMRSLLMVEKDGEKVYELARDICDAGMLDPGDRLYVIEAAGQPERFTALEGNRRLTALRLLSQQGMIDREDIGLSPAMRTKFKRLQTDFAGRWPLEVDVVIFASRDEAKRFIRLRHTGENAGAGRSAWSALQIARFDNTGLWQAIEYLLGANALDLNVVNAIDNNRFNITNFDRVSGTLEFQKRFELAIGKHSFRINGVEARAKLALSKLATDVASGRVDSRGDFAEAKGMTKYLSELDERVTAELNPEPKTEPSPPNVTPLHPTGPGEDGAGGTSGTDSGGNTDEDGPYDEPTGGGGEKPPSQAAPKDDSDTTSTKPPRKPRASKYLVDKKELLSVSSLKCRAIVDELKSKVEVQKAPFACALLVRSLQEITAELYLISIQQKPSNNAANIDAAAKHLLGNAHATDPADKMTIANAFMQARETYSELSMAAHSSLSMVSQDHVRLTWQNIKGGMDLLWKRIHANEVARKAAMAA